jgi:histidinol-phosphate/aromatic aminotransferase/cobyric acid decarboxylase-like protein
MIRNELAPMPEVAVSCIACRSVMCDSATGPIHAHNNAPGPRMPYYVPELLFHERIDVGDMSRYCGPNDPKDPLGNDLRLALSGLEAVAPQQLRVIGSGLEMMQVLPRAYDCDGVLVLENDFIGYSMTASIQGIDVHHIPCALDRRMVNFDALAKSLRVFERPLVYLTMPVTNPGQCYTGSALLRHMRSLNPQACIVIDAAYRRASSVSEDYAALALENDRTIYLNVAAKDLGACGARISWIVADATMLRQLDPWLTPYPVAPVSARYVTGLARDPTTANRIHAVQRIAKEHYEAEFRRAGFDIKTGAGPWVLLYAGENSADLVSDLANKDMILIQDQSEKFPNLSGWVRISATVPCEARRVAHCITERMLSYRVASNQHSRAQDSG